MGPKSPFPFDKIVVPCSALWHPVDKNNNKTRGGLGRVFATGMYRSIGPVEFPKFETEIFAEWKATYDYSNLGHLDKVDQLEFRKITIHSEKVSCQS